MPRKGSSRETTVATADNCTDPEIEEEEKEEGKIRQMLFYI